VPKPDEGQVWRICSTTNRVTAKIRMGKDPEQVAVRLESVWVADTDGGTVVRVDPGTNRVNRLPPFSCPCKPVCSTTVSRSAWARFGAPTLHPAPLTASTRRRTESGALP
jgi:DNA-binding beta-propeller fold protein YncE